MNIKWEEMNNKWENTESQIHIETALQMQRDQILQEKRCNNPSLKYKLTQHFICKVTKYYKKKNM